MNDGEKKRLERQEALRTNLINDNTLLILVQTFEALDAARSIHQNDMLSALYELQAYRKFHE